MKILLINQNATVEKLVRLSAEKVKLEVQAVRDAGAVTAGEYAWVLVDHEALGGAKIGDLRAKCKGAKIGLLHPKNGVREPGFDLYIEKPFLPTELTDEFSAQMGRGSQSGSESLDMELPDLDGDFSGLNLDDAGLDDEFSLDKPVAKSAPAVKAEEDFDLGDLTLDEPLGDGGHAGLEDLSLDLDKTEDSAIDLAGLESPTEDSLNMEDSLSLEEFDLASLDEEPEAKFGALRGDEPEILEQADELGGMDDLGEIGELGKTDELGGDELGGFGEIEEAAVEPKISILDREEVEKVKELLSEEDIGEDASQSVDALSLGEDFSDLLGDEEEISTATGDEIKLELGENSALLDEDDLADLHKPGGTLEDESLLDDSFGDIEELEPQMGGVELDSLEDSMAEAPMPEFDFSEQGMGADFAGSATIGADEDLESLSEESLAMALGEELPAKPRPVMTEAMQSVATSAPAASAAQSVAKGSIESALGTLSTGTLRELLDGMQLTINITFPNKKS